MERKERNDGFPENEEKDGFAAEMTEVKMQVLHHGSSSLLQELKEAGFFQAHTQEELEGCLARCREESLLELERLGICQLETVPDVLRMCSGTGPDGMPNGMAVLSLPDRKGEIGRNIAPLGAPSLQFYASGDCTVMTADFLPDARFSYERARKLLLLWETKKETSEYRDRELILFLAPRDVTKNCARIFRNLVFSQGFLIGNSIWRLLLVFDSRQDLISVSTETEKQKMQEEIIQELYAMQAEEVLAISKEEELDSRREAEQERMRELFTGSVQVPCGDSEGKKEKGYAWTRLSKR